MFYRGPHIRGETVWADGSEYEFECCCEDLVTQDDQPELSLNTPESDIVDDDDKIKTEEMEADQSMTTILDWESYFDMDQEELSVTSMSKCHEVTCEEESLKIEELSNSSTGTNEESCTVQERLLERVEFLKNIIHDTEVKLQEIRLTLQIKNEPEQFSVLKRTLIQRHIALLLYVYKSQQMAGFHFMDDFSLSHSWSRQYHLIKDLLRHMSICSQGKNCQVPHCVSSHQIIYHWRTCQLHTCPVCTPLRPTPSVTHHPDEPIVVNDPVPKKATPSTSKGQRYNLRRSRRQTVKILESKSFGKLDKLMTRRRTTSWKLDMGQERSNDEPHEKEGQFQKRDREICICGKPQKNRLMICCDECNSWFHGECVNVTKFQATWMEKKGAEWVCPFCQCLTSKY